MHVFLSCSSIVALEKLQKQDNTKQTHTGNCSSNYIHSYLLLPLTTSNVAVYIWSECRWVSGPSGVYVPKVYRVPGGCCAPSSALRGCLLRWHLVSCESLFIVSVVRRLHRMKVSSSGLSMWSWESNLVSLPTWIATMIWVRSCVRTELPPPQGCGIACWAERWKVKQDGARALSEARVH